MATPFFEDFPTELLAHVLQSCSSVRDVLNLSSTCRRLRRIYSAPGRRLEILEAAVESEHGPIQDAVNLVTHNASQPAHLVRSVPMSMALLTQVVQVGTVANRWADDIYPFKKWKDNYEDRRLLYDSERAVLRRALYRLWLYRRAFCNAMHPRTMRMTPGLVLERASLLHNFSTDELGEMFDLHGIMRETLSVNVCPSNGTIQRKFRKRHPDGSHQLLFNMHLNYPPPPVYPTAQEVQQYKYYAKYRPTAMHEPGCEGWGDDIAHYYVVEDMLKLDPEQILWLKEHAPSKFHVESYVRNLGPWFENNGDTFQETLEAVLSQRGVDVPEFLDEVVYGEVGIARNL